MNYTNICLFEAQKASAMTSKDISSINWWIFYNRLFVSRVGHCHMWDKLSVFETLPGYELAKRRTFLIHVILMPTLISDKPICKKKCF